MDGCTRRPLEDHHPQLVINGPPALSRKDTQMNGKTPDDIQTFLDRLDDALVQNFSVILKRVKGIEARLTRMESQLHRIEEAQRNIS